jgi:hypothetical protein
MKYKLILLAASFLLSAQINHITAQEKLPFKISGYAIGDYFSKYREILPVPAANTHPTERITRRLI